MGEIARYFGIQKVFERSKALTLRSILSNLLLYMRRRTTLDNDKEAAKAD